MLRPVLFPLRQRIKIETFVGWSIVDATTYKRVVEGIIYVLKCNGLNEGLNITEDEGVFFGTDNIKIAVKPAWKLLLANSSYLTRQLYNLNNPAHITN